MGFLYSQFFARLPYPTGTPHAGKTVIITGGNSGLGKEAARHFARTGASTIILAVRSIDKGNAAKRDIESTTKISPDVIKVWKLDMASYASVQAFAEQVNKELDRVDIFLANAGVAPSEFRLTLEGEEENIGINVTSTFLLAALVLPKLKTSAATGKSQPTLTIVSSEVHGHTTFPQKSAPEGEIFNTLNDKTTAEKYWAEQYPVSKLLEVLAVRAIAEQHPMLDYPVTINCVNPGLCHSELGREVDSWSFWLLKLLLARTTEVGSRTLYHAASQFGKEWHGKYLSDCAVAEPAALVTSEEGKVAQERVWGELVDRLERIRPGVTRSF